VRRDQSCTRNVNRPGNGDEVDVLVMPVMVPAASSPSVMMTPTAVAHMTMAVPMSAPDLNHGTILWRQRRDT
jgi:hypothetical protein